MDFNATIKMDNAAFEDNGPEMELAMILGVIRGKVLAGERHGLLRDSNGNKVGRWDISEEGK